MMNPGDSDPKKRTRRDDFLVCVPKKDGTGQLSNPIDPIFFSIISQLIAYLEDNSAKPQALFEYASQILFADMPPMEKFSYVTLSDDLQRILKEFFDLQNKYNFSPLTRNPLGGENPRGCHWSAFTFSNRQQKFVSVLLTSSFPFCQYTSQVVPYEPTSLRANPQQQQPSSSPAGAPTGKVVWTGANSSNSSGNVTATAAGPSTQSSTSYHANTTGQLSAFSGW